MKFKYFLLFLLVCVVISVKGVDFSKKLKLQSLQCLVNEGYQFAIIRGSRSNGRVDTNLYQNVDNANKAGMFTDIYIYPCVGRNATAQINNMINSLGNLTQLVNRVWIDVEFDPKVSKVCDWTIYSPASNCLYIGEMIDAIENKNKYVGIYSNKENWRIIFKDEQCNVYKDYKLWYARYGNKNAQSFKDYQSFGGWRNPHMKQYKGNVKICEEEVDLNWIP